MISPMFSSFLSYTVCSRFAVALLLCAAVPFGCSDTANGARTEPPMPNVGSVYTMSITQDVLGNDSPAQSTLDVTLRVADMIFEGKEHVAQFAADTMISLVAYEPNGDLSIYLHREQIGPCIVEAQWLRLPFRGADSLSELLRCIPVSVSGRESSHAQARWSARPAGIEKVLVQGKEVDAFKVEARLAIYADSSATTTPVQSREYVLWFAPDLGYTVREHLVSLIHTHENSTASKEKKPEWRADTLGTSYREMTSYALK